MLRGLNPEFRPEIHPNIRPNTPRYATAKADSCIFNKSKRVGCEVVPGLGPGGSGRLWGKITLSGWVVFSEIYSLVQKAASCADRRTCLF